MRIIGRTIAVALLLAGTASAEDYGTSKPAYAKAPELDVQANGGVANYARDVTTDAGPAYGVIVGFRPWTFVGIEGQYQGATNSMDRAKNAGYDHVTANGILGDVRFGLPYVVEPFAFGGVGWQHFNQTGPLGIADRSESTVVFPFGGGLETKVGNVILGGRFTYEILNDKNVIANATNASLWTATANIGAAIQ